MNCLCSKPLRRPAELPFGIATTPVPTSGLFRLAVPGAQADVDDHVVVGQRLLDAALLRMQQLVHRLLVELEAAVRRSGRRPCTAGCGSSELAGAVHVAAAEEIVLGVLRLAAQFGADRVVVHERRRRPDVEQRDVAVVAAAVVLQLRRAPGMSGDHRPACAASRSRTRRTDAPPCDSSAARGSGTCPPRSPAWRRRCRGSPCAPCADGLPRPRRNRGS